MPTANLTTSTLAVMAFVVAFYTLIARERKTPNITVYIFSPSVLLALALITSVVEQLVRAAHGSNVVAGPQSAVAVPSSSAELILTDITEGCFLAGMLWVAFNIWRLHNRQMNFRDDNLLKNIRAYRRLRQVWRRIFPKRSYAHEPENIDKKQLLKALSDAGFRVEDSEETPTTLALCKFPLKVSDAQTGKFIAQLLEQNWCVQYTTCCRHPYEWLSRLKRHLNKPETYLATQIVVVDGYTPHFGFTDSTHEKKAELIKKDVVSYQVTPQSFAGVHTATAKAFNAFKKKSHSGVRGPMLVIYEGCRSLVDLESVEQYRIFLRHVITSERMWGGMVTLWIEPETDNPSMDLFQMYCDYVGTPEGSGGTDGNTN